MTPGRRSVLLASVVAIPLVVMVLLGAPLIVPPEVSAPPASSVVGTEAPRPSAGPQTTPALTPMPIERTVAVEEHKTRGPFGNRIRPSGVWTGEEVIVWGGWIGRPFGLGPPQPDGAAYDPDTGRWRLIAEAPMPPSAGAIGVWTGTEVLIWGGVTSTGPGPWPVGAAYNPATDSWRTMARAPVRFGFESAAVWTGTEWVFAVERRGAIRFAVYDPENDSWRRLPDLPGDTDENLLLWTGSEILFRSYKGIYRLPPGASAWVPNADQVTGQEISGPVSVNGRVLGLHQQHGLMEWHAATDTWDTVSLPPRPVSGFGFTAVGENLLVFGGADDGSRPDLAFDLVSGEWWELSWPELEHRSDEVALWSGDQLFIWGGWIGGPTGRPAYQYGVLYSPDW
jgi:hypothetical protein